jgi:hypothetical protein
MIAAACSTCDYKCLTAACNHIPLIIMHSRAASTVCHQPRRPYVLWPVACQAGRHEDVVGHAVGPHPQLVALQLVEHLHCCIPVVLQYSSTIHPAQQCSTSSTAVQGIQHISAVHQAQQYSQSSTAVPSIQHSSPANPAQRYSTASTAVQHLAQPTHINMGTARAASTGTPC